MNKGLLSYLENIPDRRIERCKRYPLIEILFLTIVAVMSGCSGWEDIETFGLAKLSWLKKYLPYENGNPVDDTIARVISSISSKALQENFVQWMQVISEITEGEVIPIDGKTVRRSFDKRNRKSAIHMVSAFASKNGVVLGQEKVDAKSNEITAIPKLLELLEIKNCIVTIDAMGCQREIAEKIVEKKADYILAVKENQKELYEDIKDFFETGRKKDFAGIPYEQSNSHDKGHGRIEQRTCYVSSLPAYLKEHTTRWKNLKSIVCVETIRESGDKKQLEQRYYISSLSGDAEKIEKAVRKHWSIENSLHWVLDVTFREDDSRIRRENAPENLAMLRHITFNLLKKESSRNRSVKHKRLLAGLDDKYRDLLVANVLFNKEL